MSETLKIKERLALLLMSDKDETKKLILYLVYITIQRNQGITINQICTLLNQQFHIKRDQVESALAALSNSQIFDSVSKFEERNNVVHLRCKESSLIHEWLKAYCNQFPEACTLDAPIYKRSSANGNAFAKV